MNEVRIISGKWRRRKITFPNALDLRPTHDRIRETLFNWLQPYIENANCLDVFAGSGALGFEALSRAARSVTFYDINALVISALKKNAEILKADNAIIQHADLLNRSAAGRLRVLQDKDQKFDIIFCDPPFDKNLLLATCEKLVSDGLLNKNALIYLECKKGSVDFALLPSTFKIIKHKQTQTIDYLLCQFAP